VSSSSFLSQVVVATRRIDSCRLVALIQRLPLVQMAFIVLHFRSLKIPQQFSQRLHSIVHVQTATSEAAKLKRFDSSNRLVMARSQVLGEITTIVDDNSLPRVLAFWFARILPANHCHVAPVGNASYISFFFFNPNPPKRSIGLKSCENHKTITRFPRLRFRATNRFIEENIIQAIFASLDAYHVVGSIAIASNDSSSTLRVKHNT
jgi:hypothetical protein